MARFRRPRERDLSACASSSVRSSTFFFRFFGVPTARMIAPTLPRVGSYLFDPRAAPALQHPPPRGIARRAVIAGEAGEREARSPRGRLAEGRVHGDPLPLQQHLGPRVPAEGGAVPCDPDCCPPRVTGPRRRGEPASGPFAAAGAVGAGGREIGRAHV